MLTDVSKILQLHPKVVVEYGRDGVGGPSEELVAGAAPACVLDAPRPHCPIQPCWYDDMEGAYWCAWDVSFGEVQNRVKQLANTIGECYQVPPDYDATLSFAFVDVPNSASMYINGIGGTVFLSIARGSRKGGIQDSR